MSVPAAPAPVCKVPVQPVRRPALKQRLAVWLRWLHIYGSMLGLVALLFFSVTGLTLNHPEWLFGSGRTETQAQGKVDVAWLTSPAIESRRLEIVEHLRAAHRIRILLDTFEAEDEECLISFKGPGQSADVFMDRKTGAYQITLASEGVMAILNDFHKGSHTGPAWKLVIDITAILLAFVSMTGLGLLFYIKRRRKYGLILMGLGGVVLLVFWLFR